MKAYYCKSCGNVYSEYDAKKNNSQRKCPICKSDICVANEDIEYFEGRTEKTLPSWKDVLRYKYLKDADLDKNLFNKVVENEKMSQERILKSMKTTTPKQTNQPTQVTCPYCHSTNTKKISGLSKAGSVGLFGIFAIGKVSKQWHCNDCGSDF